ncbi:carbamoyltransferase N-terminal domain-containing protein [Caulobacter sp. UNC279MFTsu5.1]|uniref:carbamoyltransferase family protein n=1 Tax=Caulobacter sp. UNC279MFTsu5.1 TaxID=1502775 RepID=UPI0008E3452F|nr:carbamoyltransferase N-terminal domain-containing protein [Caulobacter sp. UNC279MFTsu5.1]SFK33671.1 carbamoyltransferase [Caulobacter sp. UNC279MFTsu5.1]
MKILGISAHYHDSAAALVVDGLPVGAVQQERLSRRKNDAAFPLEAIEWCLDHAGLQPEDLDAVVFYERPMLKFDRILISALRAFPHGRAAFAHAMKNSLGEKAWVRGLITAQLGVPRDRILFTEHHQSHAAAAFLTAPTRRAAIMTTDGVGEWATLTVGRGERPAGGPIRIVLDREVRFPHSLGMLYSTFTAYLGFSVNEGEYKVMGLAAYGRPTMADQVRKVIRRTSDGAFALELDYFAFHTTVAQSYSRRFVDLFGPPRQAYEPIDLATPEGRRFADIAASVQAVLEEILVDMTRGLHAETGLPDLCLGGGVALNGVANARILAESGFERVFVPPAPGDAGSALGAALYADRIHFCNPDRDVPDHPFWGPSIDDDELARLAGEDGLPAATLNDAALVEQTADDLAAGKVVGWMEGATEFGPRALGHRSILTAPHDVALRDRLNRDIKYREEFRPFAPVVPIEAADRYFQLPPGGARLARFMSGVFPVRPEWRERLAAVTHVDGTARVQALERSMAPRLHDLLEAYGRRSGLPVLLNTSFNLAGEPIVNRVVEGYSTFRRSGIDVLVAGRCRIVKRARARTSLIEELA